MDPLLDDKTLRRIMTRSIRPREGERIYLSGNAYGLEILDPLAKFLREAGAKVAARIWSDETLLADILDRNPSTVAGLWMPRRLQGRTFEIEGAGRRVVDKVVTLFSSPTELPPSRLAKGKGAEREEKAKRIGRFHEAGSLNLMNAQEAGVPFVLLDLPARPLLEELGLDETEVRAIYARALAVDPREVRRRNRAAARFFKGKTEVRITCPRGTDFSFRLGGADWRFEDLSLGTDRMVQLPGGEAYVPPVSSTGIGEIVTGPAGRERKAMFRRGKAVKFFERKRGRWIGASHPMVNGREPFCEFGIGTNPEAPAIATGPIYEKALGTVHVGIGGNAFFGGPIRRKRHRDFIVENPRVEADGRLFTENGVWASG